MDVAQYVHQIADIEADFEFAALVGDFEFFAGFFLLVVAAHDAQKAGLQEQARAAEFFVGKDGGTFKRAQKLGTGNEEDFVVVQRDDAVEVGEFAVDDFADDGRAVALEAYLVVEQLDADGFGRVVQQFEEFQNGFARQDDFGFGQFGFDLAGGVGKAVAVGGDEAQLVAFNLHQQAVEVVADVLYCHAVLDL